MEKGDRREDIGERWVCVDLDARKDASSAVIFSERKKKKKKKHQFNQNHNWVIKKVIKSNFLESKLKILKTKSSTLIS